MTKVVTAPEPFNIEGFKIYLGGAIDMGEAVNWQAEVISQLDNQQNLVLLNPRRTKFTQDTVDEQINWELRAMEASELIIMWFPKEAEAPISLFETGLYLKTDKLVLGAEEGFFRRRNLELTSEYYSVKLWSSLKELTNEAVRRMLKYLTT